MNNKEILELAKTIQRASSDLMSGCNVIDSHKLIADASRRLIEIASQPEPMATTPEDIAALREALRNLTSNEVITVRFIKSDGSIRDMRCTRNSQASHELAADRALAAEKGKPEREPSDDVLPVWDMDAKGWRSFRFDRVVSYETL